jgi:MFS superfamily sulfate permease-like transporter
LVSRREIVEPLQRIAERRPAGPLFSSLRRLPRTAYLAEILAGATLVAIAVPEQLATAQLAEVPSFLALLAFIVASVLFAMVGSNPILSVGADSTIAPLFAVALLRLAAPDSAPFLALVSATAVLTGLLVLAVGLFRLGWLADFLSQPIVAGFMTGIGLTIIVHQLPNALGVSDVSGTFVHRLATVADHLGQVNGWTVGLAVGTVLVIVIGERVNRRAPFALLAVVAATVVTAAGGLAGRGVATLGTVSVVAPSWRLSALSWADMGVVATTAATVAVVVLSQSAATSRSTADEMGVDVDINRDLVAIGLANAAAGLVGAIPVNASPARTGVVRLAGGRTQLVGLVAAALALLVIPFAPAMRDLPLAALAGVLFFVAARLLKVRLLRQIARVDRTELGLAVVTGLAVIAIGVQEGLAVAVGLAILDQTRRSARPRAVVLGRRPATTSWEPIGREGAAPVDEVTVLLFTAPLFFANAALFRSEVHAALRAYPTTRHFVVDAAAITDIDFTGLAALGEIVADLRRDGVNLVLARAGDSVLHALAHAPAESLHSLASYPTVDEAVRAIEG